MYDHSPQRPLIAIAPEEKSEDFQTRVLRELAAISERLARLEAKLVVKIVPDPVPDPYTGVVNVPIRRVAGPT